MDFHVSQKELCHEKTAQLTFNGWLCMLTPTRARLLKQDVQTHSCRGYQNKIGTPIHAEPIKT